jgi:hypothetical protein
VVARAQAAVVLVLAPGDSTRPVKRQDGQEQAVPHRQAGRVRKGDNMSQNDKVLQHLEKWGSITARDAYECYGIMRLGARIDDLRHRGHRIFTQMEQGENRYGERTRYARYRLEA